MRKFTKQISVLLAFAAAGSITIVNAAQNEDTPTMGVAVDTLKSTEETTEMPPLMGDVADPVYSQTPTDTNMPIGTAAPPVYTTTETEINTDMPIGTVTPVSETVKPGETRLTRVTWSTENGVPDPSEYIVGDVLTDGSVDLTDLTFLSQWLLGDKNFTSINQQMAADVTKDGDINIADLAQLKMVISMGTH